MSDSRRMSYVDRVGYAIFSRGYSPEEFEHTHGEVLRPWLELTREEQSDLREQAKAALSIMGETPEVRKLVADLHEAKELLAKWKKKAEENGAQASRFYRLAREHGAELPDRREVKA